MKRRPETQPSHLSQTPSPKCPWMMLERVAESGLASASTSGSNVPESPQAQEGVWREVGDEIHESNKFHPVGSLGKGPGHQLRLVRTSDIETMKTQTCVGKRKGRCLEERESQCGESGWSWKAVLARHGGGSPSSDPPGPLSRGL